MAEAVAAVERGEWVEEEKPKKGPTYVLFIVCAPWLCLALIWKDMRDEGYGVRAGWLTCRADGFFRFAGGRVISLKDAGLLPSSSALLSLKCGGFAAAVAGLQRKGSSCRHKRSTSVFLAGAELTVKKQKHPQQRRVSPEKKLRPAQRPKLGCRSSLLRTGRLEAVHRQKLRVERWIRT